MKLYIKANSDYSSMIQRINDLAKQKKTSSITDILNDIPVGGCLRVATDESMSRTTYFDKTEKGWEDYPYTYSSWDIADEIVRGRFRYVYDIEIYTGTIKPNMPDRYAPPMWRK